MHVNMHDIDDLLTTGAPIHTINEHLADGHHTVTYKALTCKYQRNSSQAGSSRSICAVTALNCVRLAFQLGAEEGDEETVLGSFVSEEMVNQVMNIANDLSFNDLEIDDLFEVPIFKETIVSKVRERAHHSLETFKDFFIQSFTSESFSPITAVVFTQTPEHLVCFRFQSSDSCIFVIFDTHSRPEHPYGPAFILASDVDVIATYLNQLLTKPSISKSTQDATANSYSFTALIIESREKPSTIDIKDLLASSAYLSKKLGTTDRTPSNLELGTQVPEHLERLRVRAESLRTQKLADAAHKSDNNRQTSHTRPSTPARKKDAVPFTKVTRRSEFGWQLNLQVSSPPSTLDPKNNKDPNLAESPSPLKAPTTDSRKKNEFDWIAALMPNAGQDGEDVDISLTRSSASKADKKNVPDATLSHMRSRTEFGWQMALQQPSKTDKRTLGGGRDVDIIASALVPQADVQTHGVLGKEKEEASGEPSTTPMFRKRSQWQLQEDEEVVASSSRYLFRDSKPLPSTEGESSTIHRDLRQSSTFSTYFDFDAIHKSDPNREFVTLELPTNEFPGESHECGVCNELYDAVQVIELPVCTHTFCRECLRTFTKTKISEGRYPIFCPVCAIDRTKVNQSHITQAIVERLELSEQELDKLNALQLVAHSVILHCPKCKQTMNVDRGEYATQRIIICPLPVCRHKWCKECLKPLASSQTEHNCKQHGFDRLMRRKGWKYCPGCKTPVQKETGCNHMTCASPGCNVHFCYKCGLSIIDTSNGGDVGTAVTEHYIDCVMFEKRRRCVIQ